MPPCARPAKPARYGGAARQRNVAAELVDGTLDRQGNRGFHANRSQGILNVGYRVLSGRLYQSAPESNKCSCGSIYRDLGLSRTLMCGLRSRLRFGLNDWAVLRHQSGRTGVPFSAAPEWGAPQHQRHSPTGEWRWNKPADALAHGRAQRLRCRWCWPLGFGRASAMASDGALEREQLAALRVRSSWPTDWPTAWQTGRQHRAARARPLPLRLRPAAPT
jgi:hypothetical protein